MTTSCSKRGCSIKTINRWQQCEYLFTVGFFQQLLYQFCFKAACICISWWVEQCAICCLYHCVSEWTALTTLTIQLTIKQQCISCTGKLLRPDTLEKRGLCEFQFLLAAVWTFECWRLSNSKPGDWYWWLLVILCLKANKFHHIHP